MESLANEPKKPDFMTNPHRYFRDRNAPTLLEMKAPPKAIAESILFYKILFFLKFLTKICFNKALKSAFDEKSLFPKSILDNEAKMKSDHKNILSKLNNS